MNTVRRDFELGIIRKTNVPDKPLTSEKESRLQKRRTFTAKARPNEMGLKEPTETEAEHLAESESDDSLNLQQMRSIREQFNNKMLK